MHTDTEQIHDLTATVRVVKIGPKQLTQTTAKQLDQVPFDTLHVFGRINLNGIDGINFIGRHHTTGALARARVQPSNFDNPEQFRAWRNTVAPGYPLIILDTRR